MSKIPKWEYGVQWREGGPIKSWDDMGDWEANSVIYSEHGFTHRRRYGPKQPWQPHTEKKRLM